MKFRYDFHFALYNVGWLVVFKVYVPMLHTSNLCLADMMILENENAELRIVFRQISSERRMCLITFYCI